VLLIIIMCLSNLLRQRISVPEFSSESWRNSQLIISNIISIIAMIFLTFYNEETIYYSRRYLGLVDNVLFFIYLSSSFMFCLNTYLLLMKLNIREIPKESTCLNFKRYLIMVMAIQLLCCK
jgi:hypothetical protein